MNWILHMVDQPAFAGGRPKDGGYFLRNLSEQEEIELTGSAERARKFPSPAEAFSFWNDFPPLAKMKAEIVSEDLQEKACLRCARYEALGDGGKVYEWMPPEGYREAGATLYVDVDRAAEIVMDGRQPEWIQGEENIQPYIDNHEMCTTHIDHVPGAKPGLLIEINLTVAETGGPDQISFFIDGHHRLAQALRDGRPFFFYALTPEESARVCTQDQFALLGDELTKELERKTDRQGKDPLAVHDEIQGLYFEKYFEFKGGEEEATRDKIYRLRALWYAAYRLADAKYPGHRSCPLARVASARCMICQEEHV